MCRNPDLSWVEAGVSGGECIGLSEESVRRSGRPGLREGEGDSLEGT